jgi:hypothetical protein
MSDYSDEDISDEEEEYTGSDISEEYESEEEGSESEGEEYEKILGRSSLARGQPSVPTSVSVGIQPRQPLVPQPVVTRRPTVIPPSVSQPTILPSTIPQLTTVQPSTIVTRRPTIMPPPSTISQPFIPQPITYKPPLISEMVQVPQYIPPSTPMTTFLPPTVTSVPPISPGISINANVPLGFTIPQPYVVKPVLYPRRFRTGVASTPSVVISKTRRNIPKAKQSSWYRDAHDVFLNTPGASESLAKCYVNTLAEGCDYIPSVQDTLNKDIKH